MSVDFGFISDFAGPGQWAAEYRKVGMQVIPCVTPHEDPVNWKRPKLSEWRTLQEDLVNDAVFERWYGEDGEHFRRYNMGVVTGRASGNLLVIDLDIHKNPEAGQWWRGLIALENAGLEPETAEQRTGGGGLQKFFRAPAGRHCPTNKTPIGVDVRGQGGFAVIPPSRHESGQDYDWLPGRAPWEAGIAEAPEWLLNAVDDLVEAHGGHQGGSGRRVPGESQTPELDAWGKAYEGREQIMRDHVYHAVLEWGRECPILAPEREWQVRSWESYLDYEQRVTVQKPLPGESVRDGLHREGRGGLAYWQKWRLMMKKWGTPEFMEAMARPNPREQEPAAQFEQAQAKAEEQAKADPGTLFEFLDVAQIKALPDPQWLVQGLMVEQALGFIYGPPGCLKTFLALDLALSFASGQGQWWGRPVQRPGAVVYISSEGIADLKFRIMAWEAHRKVDADPAPFYLIRQSINFMNGSDIGTLVATVEAIAALAGVSIAAVFVDTVSRVLPGSDENLQKDMTIFVAACDVVRQRFGATVVGIHHTPRAGNMRGSTVIPGAGDFLIEMRREPGAETGSIFAAKIKAAEDGWEQHFRVHKVEVGTITKNTSLVLDPAEPMIKDSSLGWPERDVCRQILSAIDEEWCKKRPWCHALNTSRAAVTNIVKRWHLERPIVVDILATWTANGVISEEMWDTDGHVRGYRKLIDL